MTEQEAIRELQDRIDIATSDGYADKTPEYIGALKMAIEALESVRKHEEAFEFCTDCKEYDKEKNCCHRWNKVINNTLKECKND